LGTHRVSGIAATGYFRPAQMPYSGCALIREVT